MAEGGAGGARKRAPRRTPWEGLFRSFALRPRRTHYLTDPLPRLLIHRPGYFALAGHSVGSDLLEHHPPQPGKDGRGNHWQQEGL